MWVWHGCGLCYGCVAGVVCWDTSSKGCGEGVVCRQWVWHACNGCGVHAMGVVFM